MKELQFQIKYEQNFKFKATLKFMLLLYSISIVVVSSKSFVNCAAFDKT